MIEFDAYDLLELFASEPEFPLGEEQQIYWYEIENKLNITLKLYISVYENKCRVSIFCKNQAVSLFEKRLINVKNITRKEESLYINLEDGEFYKIYFSPYFAIRINEED